MIQKLLFGSRALSLTKGGLDAGATRMRVIAENVANAATPGYLARDVKFEELITESQAAMSVERTHADHIAPGQEAAPEPRVTVTSDAIVEGAVNNVDLEQELVRMKQNEIHYNALSQLLARKYKGIEGAIR